MKRSILYITIALLLSLVITGCEDIFIRELDFKSDGEPEMLVLSANNRVGLRPNVLLYHSFYFGHAHSQADKGIIKDAEVTVRINSTEWHLNDSTQLPRLQALDTVEVIATHPDYPTVTAHQVMPNKASAHVVSWTIRPNYWMDIVLEIDPYVGNQDDVVGVLFNSGSLNLYKGEKKVKNFQFSGLYSTDVVFAEALNMSAEGYYCTKINEPLFLPSSALQQPLQIHLIADCPWGMDNKNNYTKATLSSLNLEICAYTYDTYLYWQSKRLATDMQYYMGPPSGIGNAKENVLEDILEDLRNMLGEQEPVRMHTNVQGGLGYLNGYSSTAVSIKP